MTRRYGRGPRGERLVAAVPHGHWKTTTFVAGLRYDGLTAPFVIDGPINGDWFVAYVEQVLAPTLSQGDIVIIPQSRWCSRCHRSGGRDPPVPAAIFTRSQSDRTGLRQNQSATAKGRGTIHRRSLERNREPDPNLLAQRMRKLSGKFRLSTPSLNPL
jgi:hypothetical protein